MDVTLVTVLSWVPWPWGAEGRGKLTGKQGLRQETARDNIPHDPPPSFSWADLVDVPYFPPNNCRSRTRIPRIFYIQIRAKGMSYDEWVGMSMEKLVLVLVSLMYYSKHRVEVSG